MTTENYLDLLASRLDLTLSEAMSTCQVLGIDLYEYGDLIEEMWGDGHTPEEIRQMVDVLEGSEMLVKIQRQTPEL